MSDEKSPNAADREQVAAAKKLEKEVRKDELADMRLLLSDPAGRRFLWRMLKRCGLYRLSYTGNSETYLREGERNVGLWLMTELSQANPDAFFLMQKENMKQGDVTHV